MDDRSTFAELAQRLAEAEAALRGGKAELHDKDELAMRLRAALAALEVDDIQNGAAPATELAALRESEERYRTVFQSIDEGVVTFDVIRDTHGKAVDAIYVETNAALARMTGLTIDIVGKRMSEVLPDLEPFWFDTFSRVISTGEPSRFEYKVRDLEDGWFDVFASRVGGDGSARIVMVYNNITARKRAETALRESEEPQAFLVKLSDALRALSDPTTVQNTAMVVLGRRLGAFRAQYFEAESDGDHVNSVAGFSDPPEDFVTARIRMDDFGAFVAAGFRAGETVVIRDTATDVRVSASDLESYRAYGMGAYIAVPLVKNGRFVVCIGVHSASPRNWTKLEIRIVEETAERTWAAVERARAEAGLRESEQRFAQFAEASSDALWIRDARTLAMEYVSSAIDAIYGVEPSSVLGDLRRWASLIVPDDRELALAHIAQAREGKNSVHEFRVQRPGDGIFRWVRDTCFPLFDAQGRVQRIGGIAQDVTEAKLAAEHQSVLLAELQHRVRNIMAMIRSVIARTGERARTVADYESVLMGRMLALARVQALLTRAANIEVGIASLVHEEVSAQAQHEGQYALHGPDIALSPKAAEVLTLAVHELSTNALKYGALSVPDGKVTVTWSTFEKRGAPWLAFDWTEQGAPLRPQASMEQTGRRGFGSELIEGKVPYELKGKGRIAIEAGGAHCRIEFPLREGASILETGAPERAIVFGGALDMTGEADLSGHRVLIVEDDYYLAADTARALRGAGADIIGPCATEADARAELEEQTPTAVVVDINLGPGPSFKLAQSLKDSGIPFVFITGYDQTVIPAEFEGVERLQKPVQLRQIVAAVSRLTAT